MSPRPSITGIASAVIAGAVSAFYVVLIVQGDLGPAGVRLELGSVLWAMLLWLLTLMVGAGALAPPTSRARGLLALGAGGLTVVGVLALFSIGMPLLVAAALAWVAFVTRR